MFIDRQIVRELAEQKTPKVLATLPQSGENWRVHYAIFTPGEITPAALAEMQKLGGTTDTLEMLDREN